MALTWQMGTSPCHAAHCCANPLHSAQVVKPEARPDRPQLSFQSRVSGRPCRALKQLRCQAISGESTSGQAASGEHAPQQWWPRLQQAALAAAAAAALTLPAAPLPPAAAAATAPNPAYADTAILIAGQPIKDPKALLRYALPIDNQAIKNVQQPLEEITEDLRVPGTKALDGVERHIRQANRALNQNKDNIIGDIAERKRDEASKLVEKLADGLQDFQRLVEAKDRAGVVPKQRELLEYVGNIEEAMVDQFPFEIPQEFAGRPLLKGRATVEMKVRVKNNNNLSRATLAIAVDGYSAPVTAGNFVDLVERRFYDGMEIQRADGFVVQTGDPEGPAEGFIDPNSGVVRTVPLEIKVEGDKAPFYHDTLEELGAYKATTTLPFNAFGTMAMAREEFSNDSASSQIFWLLKESELTPSNANILDGRYTVFGYVVENQDLLADLKVGDVIESMRVTQGIENLANPSYK